MKKIWIISFLVTTACASSDIESLENQEQFVVEGWVTDQNKQHWVKISTPVSFGNSSTKNPVKNARVIIEDGTNIFPLPHSADGLYLTDALAGIASESYRLTIELASGETIQSGWERLNSLPPINSIRYDVFEEQDPKTGENIQVYFPIVVSSDPITETNFYRYKGFRNGKLLNEPNQLILLSDQFINGASALPNFIPEFRYSFGDTIQVELHSLTKTGFDFFQLLKSQTNSLGRSSGTSPAMLIGNLKNLNDESQIVLGFFGASSVSSDTTIIN